MQEENYYVRMERRRNNDTGQTRQNAKERMAFPGRKNANKLRPGHTDGVGETVRKS